MTSYAYNTMPQACLYGAEVAHLISELRFCLSNKLALDIPGIAALLLHQLQAERLKMGNLGL